MADQVDDITNYITKIKLNNLLIRRRRRRVIFEARAVDCSVDSDNEPRGKNQCINHIRARTQLESLH